MTAPPMTMACSGADPADDRARARTAAGRAASRASADPPRPLLTAWPKVAPPPIALPPIAPCNRRRLLRLRSRRHADGAAIDLRKACGRVGEHANLGGARQRIRQSTHALRASTARGRAGDAGWAGYVQQMRARRRRCEGIGRARVSLAEGRAVHAGRACTQGRVSSAGAARKAC